jgi:uncharacterized small protein (DUF1192 family)
MEGGVEMGSMFDEQHKAKKRQEEYENLKLKVTKLENRVKELENELAELKK